MVMGESEAGAFQCHVMGHGGGNDVCAGVRIYAGKNTLETHDLIGEVSSSSSSSSASSSCDTFSDEKTEQKERDNLR